LADQLAAHAAAAAGDYRGPPREFGHVRPPLRAGADPDMALQPTLSAGGGYSDLQIERRILPPHRSGWIGVSDHPRRVRIEGQGITEIGQIKAGETVVVSSAAGATGSVAGQIAKIKGCRVIGTAGGKEKCDWLVEEAHFDAAIDYKNEDVGTRLSELCPNGIDVFFDNVGGAVLNEVLTRINLHARIVLCGSISKSDAATPQPGPTNYSNLVARRARMEGFTGLDYPTRVPEAFEALGRWQRDGSLVHKEDVAYGLEKAPQALLRLFSGENFGKQLVKVADLAA
jgi:NADPH-dependent curcumin reductase